MKFSPRLPSGNVNVSRTHPLIELFWLAGGLLLITAVVFFILGFLTDWAVSKTPVKIENWLGQVALEHFPADQHPELTDRLTGLLTSLPEDSPLQQYDFQVFLSDLDEVNAIALPGGRIVVYSGLIRQIESENELMMVLGHELGHFAHRDHLRGLGRGLGVVVATTLLFGQGSTAGDLVSNALLSFKANYSQDQEAAADRFGLVLLNDHYGHVGGGIDFFARLAKKAGSHVPYLLASHPHPEYRIENLKQLIDENNYQVRTPIPFDLKL